MKTINRLIPVAFAVLAFACGKIQSLPDTPKIEYTDFTVFDTVDILGNAAKGGRLKFKFEDGDGDLGLPTPAADSESLDDSVNLFLTLYRMKDGVMGLAPDNDPMKPSNYRIPYMEVTGQNKILKGTIAVTFFYLFYSNKDTVRYDFYVKDRAQHISNTQSTATIPLYYNGVYK
ncbi:MAG: hypothetical protein Q8868_00290 [Bacteroidota bacterium]|nr:hypothetical protein [Bacteroidota bacterium]